MIQTESYFMVKTDSDVIHGGSVSSFFLSDFKISIPSVRLDVTGGVILFLLPTYDNNMWPRVVNLSPTAGHMAPDEEWYNLHYQLGPFCLKRFFFSSWTEPMVISCREISHNMNLNVNINKHFINSSRGLLNSLDKYIGLESQYFIGTTF